MVVASKSGAVWCSVSWTIWHADQWNWRTRDLMITRLYPWATGAEHYYSNTTVLQCYSKLGRPGIAMDMENGNYVFLKGIRFYGSVHHNTYSFLGGRGYLLYLWNNNWYNDGVRFWSDSNFDIHLENIVRTRLTVLIYWSALWTLHKVTPISPALCDLLFTLFMKYVI